MIRKLLHSHVKREDSRLSFVSHKAHTQSVHLMINNAREGGDRNTKRQNVWHFLSSMSSESFSLVNVWLEFHFMIFFLSKLWFSYLAVVKMKAICSIWLSISFSLASFSHNSNLESSGNRKNCNQKKQIQTIQIAWHQKKPDKKNQFKIQTTIKFHTQQTNWKFTKLSNYKESTVKSLSVSNLSPLGSHTSFSTLSQTRIENVVDWEAISKKYRALFGLEGDDSSSLKEGSSDDDNKSKVIDTGVANDAAGKV